MQMQNTNDLLIVALSNLHGSSWATCGLSVDAITWKDEHETTEQERQAIQAELARLQAEYAAKEYQRNRAAEYPSFAEQFDTLYHGGYDAWKATIDSVKAKYPKP
jgi:hypothetical protein